MISSLCFITIIYSIFTSLPAENRTCSNHRPFFNISPRQYGCARADPDIVLNDNFTVTLSLIFNGLRLVRKVVVLTIDDNIGTYKNVFSNFYSTSTIQNTVSIDTRVVSNNQAAWEINDYIFPYIDFFSNVKKGSSYITA